MPTLKIKAHSPLFALSTMFYYLYPSRLLSDQQEIHFTLCNSGLLVCLAETWFLFFSFFSGHMEYTYWNYYVNPCFFQSVQC